ncbi:hypothetical protein CYY_001058 [Polysphondylium violaceum]|uniref:AP complex subunit sigma n=1 Tax=Polysphondylium violaceum TaxID=133409 RepID=A0A8J4V1Y4_9MYCE|nr:hypothetical protein CYY_001058 [Polysphondylium violaceum]
MLLAFNRQGKVRLSKFYSTYTAKEKARYTREIINNVLSRGPNHCNFVLWREYTLVYQKYASLYFIIITDQSDNELISLEVIHQYVVILDTIFENICELDLIYDFERAYLVLDEFLLAGEMQDTSSKEIVKNYREALAFEKHILITEALDQTFSGM